MTEAVLDASAVLAYLLNEPGQDVVHAAIESGASCSTVNLSEVVQKLRVAGGDWKTASAILGAWGLVIEPPTAADAVKAADLWRETPHLSLADRFCLATAARLGVPALTADRSWGSSDTVRQIR